MQKGRRQRGTGWQTAHTQTNGMVWLGKQSETRFIFLFFQSTSLRPQPLHCPGHGRGLNPTLPSGTRNQNRESERALPEPHSPPVLCRLFPRTQSHLYKNGTGLDSGSKFLTNQGLRGSIQDGPFLGDFAELFLTLSGLSAVPGLHPRWDVLTLRSNPWSPDHPASSLGPV